MSDSAAPGPAAPEPLEPEPIDGALADREVVDAALAAPSAPREEVTEQQVVVRRTPRYLTFILLGAIVFGVAAAVVTYAMPYDPETSGYDRNVVFGFVLVFAVAVGVAIGVVAALIAERATRRSAVTMTAEHVRTTPREP